MRWRILSRRALTLVGILMACVVIAYLGPIVLRKMAPPHLAVAEGVIERIWWPATALRGVVYAVLAWGVYPAWVRMRLTARQAVMPPAGTEKEHAVHEAHLAHLHRAAQRQIDVFGLLLISDLILAQFPYWLLRG